MKPSFKILTVLLFTGIVSHAQLIPKTKPAEPTVKSPVSVKPSPLSKPIVSQAKANNGNITLQWIKPRKETIGTTGTSKTFIGFTGAIYDAGASYLPEYFTRRKLGATTNHIKVTLSNTVFEPLSSDEVSAIWQNKTIGSDVKIISNVVEDKMVPYAQVSILPIRKNPSTGIYEKLVSFKLNIQEINEVSYLKKKATFASSSILASGTWYKIGVAADGVYKLDYNFFKKLGYNMSTLVPANIRIYGNGGAMLPAMNNVPRPDDLAENAIFVQGNGDASFGQNDYVLFYGQSPHTWSYNPNDTCTKYHHTVNLYTDTTYYFINADIGTGKRIAPESTSAHATDTVTSFDDYAYVEPDQTNLIQSGNQWFGQYFDVNLSYNIPFTFPNILAGAPVYVKTLLASRYDQSNGPSSSYTASCNGSMVSIKPATVSTGCYYCIYAQMGAGCFSFMPTLADNSFAVNVTKNTSGAIGWLYYVEVNARRPLSLVTDQMEFRDAQSIANNAVSAFKISTFSNLQVWDVSNPQNVASVTLTNTKPGTYLFTEPSDSLRQYIAFNGNTYLTPTSFGLVANQNLHAFSQADLIIVTNPQFYAQALQLANFHRVHDSLTVQVATTTQVYNEFSSGKQDPVAIRDFCRMFYSRQTNYSNSLKYLLLFGDGSYDPKNRLPGNSNYVVTYESDNSFDPTNSYVTDDFYAVLQDSNFGVPVGNLDLANYSLDIGVGRLTVDNATAAQTVVNKIMSYETNSGEPITASTSCCNPQTQYNMGNWRNTICFIAHDGDDDIHLTEADQLADSVNSDYPNFNVNKIYLDAYQMVQTPGGARYPEVNAAIDKQMDNGLLIINYTGHGGQLGLAVSRVLTFDDIYSWTNVNKLSLFFTASCEFARYDDPSQISAGELCLQTANGGNIALMTTVRDVYSGGNFSLNQNFYTVLYQPLPDGSLPRLGDLFIEAKNLTGPIVNSRMFALLGDPAVRLAYPKNKVYTTAINSIPIAKAEHDTLLKALSKITITGYVGDANGNTLTGFNGLLYPTVYDKPSYEFTLDNLGGTNSPVYGFTLQKNIVFNGKASVKNGQFTFSFVVPKDIQYNLGYGKLSYYAQNGVTDATGSNDSILVGGSSPTAVNNGKGPQVRLYMNDSNFVYGGMTNENPQIFAIVTDSNGINNSGSSIGHDITAILDNNTQNTIDLNQYYSPALNSYQRGTITYPLSSLSTGTHTLSLRVWNVYNNTTQATTQFTVEPQAKLQLQHVLNYPNPFTTHTQFYFELNEVCDQLDVQIQIFTVSGKLVKNIVTSVKTDSFRSQAIDWDGKDDYGDKIANGVYIYHVKVRTSEGTTTDTYQKLVIL